MVKSTGRRKLTYKTAETNIAYSIAQAHFSNDGFINVWLRLWPLLSFSFHFPLFTRTREIACRNVEPLL